MKYGFRLKEKETGEADRIHNAGGIIFFAGMNIVIEMAE